MRARLQSLSTYGTLRDVSKPTVLIKLGGATLQNAAIMRSLCESLGLIHSAGISIILVHGGGPLINRELTARGINWSFIDGQRVTSPEMMEVIEMVLCGVVNRQIVKGLGRVGTTAVGMSGVDGNTLLCNQLNPQLGQVGEISKVNSSLIHSVLNLDSRTSRRAIPVIAPVGIGFNGEVLNINADWAAVRIAEALNIKKLIFVTDQNGILDSDGQLFSSLDSAALEDLIESGIVQGGMLAKVRAILHALNQGVSHVHIVNGNNPGGLEGVVFDRRLSGTYCEPARPLPFQSQIEDPLEKEFRHA